MRRTLNRGLRRSLGKLLPALTSCARPRRDGVECCYNLSGESRPVEIISISRVTCNHIIDAPVGRCVCSDISGVGLCFQALPHAIAAATSTALWPSARFEALEHSRPYHLVTRAVNLMNLERTIVHHVFFCLNLHQNRDINPLGDEDMGGGVMRREHAANSRGCQISLEVLVLVLSRARQGCSTSHIPAILVRPRWLRTAGLNFRSSLVFSASRPVRSPGRASVKQQPTHQTQIQHGSHQGIKLSTTCRHDDDGILATSWNS